MSQNAKGNRTNRKTKPATLPAKFRAGFLSELDGRTELSRALRANYDAVVADIGGPGEVGHIKGSLIERFCWLEAILQTLEHDLATGAIDKAEALGKWIQAVNSLTGLAKALGIERRNGDGAYLRALSSSVVEANPPDNVADAVTGNGATDGQDSTPETRPEALQADA